VTAGLAAAGILPEGADVWVPAVMIAVGILGIVVPVLPGLLLALAGVLLWAYSAGTTTAWAVFGTCAVMYLTGVVLQYLVPGRRLRQSGVGTGTLLLAVLLGIVGFFVVPIIGGPLGFVLGIYLVEHSRTRDSSAAWGATVSALKAVLVSMGIELLAGVAIATTWTVAVIVT
jgi:uncharacterized protein YqgC (DUF456 family)